jgi:hypothetical protein
MPAVVGRPLCTEFKSVMACHSGSSQRIARHRNVPSSSRSLVARVIFGALFACGLLAVTVVVVLAPIVTAWRLAGTLGTHEAMRGDDRVARAVYFAPAGVETVAYSASQLKDPDRIASIPETPPAAEVASLEVPKAIAAPQTVAAAEPVRPPAPPASTSEPKPAVPAKPAARTRLASLPAKPPSPTPAIRDTKSVARLFDSIIRKPDDGDSDSAVGSVSAYAPPDLPKGDEQKVAIYDIVGHTVHMPNGERLEAHSGLGQHFDEPASYKIRMRGPTPPNVYRLTMRERLFHGVPAIRLTPLDYPAMNGRDGILAHTYMLGPRGESNGCVSFRNYSRFLEAFRRGEVNRMIVVSRMAGSPASVIAAHRSVGGKYASGRANEER